MRSYETTFVVNPQSDDASIDRQVNAIVEIIKTAGGEIVRENRMGTRKMAYQIADLSQGYYTSIIHNSETSVLPILDRHFKLEEPYIRFLTIKYNGPMSDFDKEIELKGFNDRKFDRYNRSDNRDSRDDRDNRHGRRDHRDKDKSDSPKGETTSKPVAEEAVDTAKVETKPEAADTAKVETKPEAADTAKVETKPAVEEAVETAKVETKPEVVEKAPEPEAPISDESDEL